MCSRGAPYGVVPSTYSPSRCPGQWLAVCDAGPRTRLCLISPVLPYQHPFSLPAPSTTQKTKSTHRETQIILLLQTLPNRRAQAQHPHRFRHRPPTHQPTIDSGPVEAFAASSPDSCPGEAPCLLQPPACIGERITISWLRAMQPNKS